MLTIIITLMSHLKLLPYGWEWDRERYILIWEYETMLWEDQASV